MEGKGEKAAGEERKEAPRVLVVSLFSAGFCSVIVRKCLGTVGMKQTLGRPGEPEDGL
jgi:hypothetical protein